MPNTGSHESETGYFPECKARAGIGGRRIEIDDVRPVLFSRFRTQRIRILEVIIAMELTVLQMR